MSEYHYKKQRDVYDIRITGESHNTMINLKTNYGLRSFSDVINYLISENESLKNIITLKENKINDMRDEIRLLCKVLQNKEIPALDKEPSIYLRFAMQENGIIFNNNVLFNSDQTKSD